MFKDMYVYCCWGLLELPHRTSDSREQHSHRLLSLLCLGPGETITIRKQSLIRVEAFDGSFSFASRQFCRLSQAAMVQLTGQTRDYLLHAVDAWLYVTGHLVLNKDLDYISQESTPRTHRTLSGAIMMLGKKTITYWKRLNEILAEWNIGGLVLSLLGFLLRDWRDLQLSFALFSLVTKISYQDFFILKLKFNIKFKI